ncbi:hypothetical protein AVEN_145479-1, partial [Araneus ventricosus]
NTCCIKVSGLMSQPLFNLSFSVCIGRKTLAAQVQFKRTKQVINLGANSELQVDVEEVATETANFLLG